MKMSSIVGFIRPKSLLNSFDIWVLRVTMFLIAISYMVMYIYLKIKVERKVRKIDGLFLLAVVYSTSVLVISFSHKCYHYSICYDLDLLAVLANGLFHWFVCWLYVKAAVEMPFLFKLALYI